MMLRLVMVVLAALMLLLSAGCAQKEKAAAEPGAIQRTLCLYSELDNKFTAELVQSFNEGYNKDNKDKLVLTYISELKPGDKLPDLVLAERRTLEGLKQQKKLKSAAFGVGDKLPQELRDEDMYWYGVFYDPTVFLINQQYARTIGQESIRGWTDLENNEHLRIAMENLSDNNSTQNFLGAFADAMGETTSLNYLWNINRFVGQYAKFPFTSIRMAAVGDADVAITRQSYVFKYLENKFPAYVVHPKEGTPVNLYCAGIFKDCEHDVEALQFMEWLLASDRVQAVAQANNTGYMFVFPRGVDEPAVDAQRLWLNRSYLQTARQDALIKRWLERVRFSK